MPHPTWFSVARRPKWLFGLAFALAVAAVFALLGQWQLERSFTTVETIDGEEPVLVLTELEKPGQPLGVAAANKLVSAELYLDQSNLYIVANRLQQRGDETVPGYWLIANSSALLDDGDSTASLSVAIGFSDSLQQAEAARSELAEAMLVEAFLPTVGRYLQSEAPVARPDAAKAYLLGSFSLAELVNLYSSSPVNSFAGFLSIQSEPGYGLEQISFLPPQPGTSVNWLTLFYALEWALFGGFAIFLWWRLVEDQRLRESR